MSILVPSSNASPILLVESSRQKEVINSPTENSTVAINDSLLLSRYAATIHYLEETEQIKVPALYHCKSNDQKVVHAIEGGSAVEEEDTESEEDDDEELSSSNLEAALINEKKEPSSIIVEERKTPLAAADAPIKAITSSSFINSTPLLSSSVSHSILLPTIQTYSPQLNLTSLYSPCSTPISSIRSKKDRAYNNNNSLSTSASKSFSCLKDTSTTVQNPTSNILSSSSTSPTFNNPKQKTLYSSALASSSSIASSIKMDIRSPPQPSQSTSRFMNAFQRFRSSSINQNSKNHQNATTNNNNSVAPAEIIISSSIKPSPSKSSLADKIKTKFQQLDKKKKRASLMDVATSSATTTSSLRKNIIDNKKKSSSEKSSAFSMPRSASISSITNWSSRLTANNNNNRKSMPTITVKQQTHQHQHQHRLSHSTSMTSFLSSKTGTSLKPSLSSSSLSSCSSSSEVATTNTTVTTTTSASPITTTNMNAPLSLTKSISSHRLYKNNTLSSHTTTGSSSSSSTSTRPRQQPLRAVNPNDSVRLATRHSFQSQQRHSNNNNGKKGGNKSSSTTVRFTKLVSVRETFSKSDYDRGSDPDAVCTRLTPAMAQRIKEELNAYKLHEMQVHEYSRVHTHFFL